MGCSSQSLQAMLMGNSREKGEAKEEGNLFFFFFPTFLQGPRVEAGWTRWQ